MLAKPLTKIGNSQGVLLPRDVLALISATSPDTVFQVTVEGSDKIVLRRLSEEEKGQLVLQAAEEQMQVHGNTFEKLARAPSASDAEVAKAAKGINKRYNKMMKSLGKKGPSRRTCATRS